MAMTGRLVSPTARVYSSPNPFDLCPNVLRAVNLSLSTLRARLQRRYLVIKRHEPAVERRDHAIERRYFAVKRL
jgi:hypothetical protein